MMSNRFSLLASVAVLVSAPLLSWGGHAPRNARWMLLERCDCEHDAARFALGGRTLGNGCAALLFTLHSSSLQAALPGATRSQQAFGPRSTSRRKPTGADPGAGESTLFSKIVAMVPVRDEAHLLPSSLRALSGFADAIVVLDDCSTDGSGDVARDLAAECKIERVVRTPSCGAPEDRGAAGGRAMPYWGDEIAHRSFLLQLAREVGGTHFLAIDADEVVVVGHGQPEELADLRQSFRALQPGDMLVMPYITMYRSAATYRSDKADFKPIGFVDQPGAGFRRRSTDDRLHTPRLPHIPRPGNAFELRSQTDPPHAAVLHFGFSNLGNARMKNVIYNMFDVVTSSAKKVDEMNTGLVLQGLTRDAEAAIVHNHLARIPSTWAACLASFSFDPAAFENNAPAHWRETLALDWLLGEGDEAKGGPARFAGMLAMQVLAMHNFTSVPQQSVKRLRRLMSRLAQAAQLL